MDRAEAEKRLKALQRKSEEDQLRMANLEKVARDALAQKAPANQESMHPESASISSDHKKEEHPAPAQLTTRTGDSKEQQGEKKAAQHKKDHVGDNMGEREDEHRDRSLTPQPLARAQQGQPTRNVCAHSSRAERATNRRHERTSLS